MKKNSKLDNRDLHSLATQNSLAFNHPLYQEYEAVARSLTPSAEPTAAMMIEAAPEEGLNQVLNQEFFSTLPLDRMLNRANSRAIAAAKPSIEAAHALTMEQQGVLDDVEGNVTVLEELEAEIIEISGQEITRADVIPLLDAAQGAASRSEARGDYEHTRTGKPGAVGWFVVGLVSLLETFGVYAFMVNLADYLSLMTLIALAGILVLVNHLGGQLSGRVLKSYAEKYRLRRQAHTAGHAIIHTAVKERAQ
jgi:hypothetical protein